MDEIRQIPLTALHESPFNPRKTYPEAELLELSESIKSQGVMQPIVARIQPEEVNKAGHFDYEIIFGHRRFRAAILAGLESVPVIVRTMTDEQAAVAQVHENMKRTDVTALEEADSYVYLRDEHGMRGADIAAAVGKSVAYVYARLKLASAAPEVRAAVLTRNLSPEIALLLGRLPHHDLQRIALKQLRAPDWQQEDGEAEVWLSVRDTKTKIKALFTHDTSEAQFDLADATLSEIAGACTTCPKLAANMPGLADIVAGSICTQASCYEAKVVTFATRQTIELRAAGHRVIDGAEARELMPYPSFVRGMRRLDHSCGLQHDNPEDGTLTYGDILERDGAPTVKSTVIVSPQDGTLVYAITPEEALALENFARGVEADDEGNDEGDDEGDDEGSGESPPSVRTAALEALPPEVRVFFDQQARAKVKKSIMLAAAIADRTADDLRLILLAVNIWMDGDWGDAGDLMGLSGRCNKAAEESEHPDMFDQNEWFNDWISKEATKDQLAMLVTLWALDFAISGYWFNPDQPSHVEAADRFVTIAHRFDVDPLDPEGSPAPSLAARAQKAAEGLEAQDADASADAAVKSQSKPLAKKVKPVKKAAPAKKAAKVKIAKVDAGSAGEDQKDEPADAGVERDPNTSDMFSGEHA